MDTVIPRRSLDRKFIQDLKTGILQPLVDYVQKDPQLILEIRENYINIYHRGGNLLRVTKNRSGYDFYWDKKYAKGQDIRSLTLDSMSAVRSSTDCSAWTKKLPQLVKHMDEFFEQHKKKEKFIQHAIVTSAVLKDYIIITDFEYQKGQKARFDLMGVRTKPGKPVLSFIELKQGGTNEVQR